MQNQDKNTLASECYLRLLQAKRIDATLHLSIGMFLTFIKEDKLYTFMGEGGFDTWGQFLSQPELGLSPSTVRISMRLYKTYCQSMGFEVVDFDGVSGDRLKKLLPILENKTKEEALAIYEDVIHLGARDFSEAIRKLQVPSKKVEKPSVDQCDSCHKWMLLVATNEKCSCLTS